MANYVLNNDGTISKSKKKKKGNEYVIDNNGTVTLKQDIAPVKQTVTTNKVNTSNTTNELSPTINTINSDGYKDTGKTYGDYWYQGYSTNKDRKIYEKDGKYYLSRTKSDGTIDYQDVDTVSFMTTKDADKKDYQDAVKAGYKGSKASVTHISDKIKLDTANLNDEEYKEYDSDLKRQEEAADKELANSRETNYGGAGLKGSIGTIKTAISNIGNTLDKEVISPIKNFEDNYETGKLNNQLALEAYNKMEGKKNNYDELKQKVDTYNTFNQDLLTNPGAAGTAIQNLNTQVESLKNQGISATILGLGGAAIGGTIGGGAGALTGLKAGGALGYTFGATPYTYKLEAGNQYQTLTEMGVPDDIAKKYSRITGGVNAAIESGENIIDLATLSIASATGKGTTTVSKEAVNKMVDEYGESQVKTWLSKKLGEDTANKIIKTATVAATSYAQNIGSEALEEMTQETTSIVNERLATNEAGIKRDATFKSDVSRILEAGKSAAITTAFTAPLSSLGGAIVTNTVNNVETKIKNKKSNTTTTTEINETISQEIEKEGTNLNESEIQQIQAEVYKEVQNDNINITDLNEVNNTTTQQNDSNSLVESSSNTLNNVNDTQFENISNKEYNTTQGDLNGMGRNDKGTTREGILYEQMASKQKVGEDVQEGRIYTREEYEQFEKRASERKKSELTQSEKEIIDEVKGQLGKEIVFFNAENNDNHGGASLKNPNILYVSDKLSDNGKRFIAYHEVMESTISHDTELSNGYLKDIINDIKNDPNFKQARANFIGDETDLNNQSDYMIAKDILSDAFSKKITGIDPGYEVPLSKQTLEEIEYANELVENKLKKGNISPTETNSNNAQISNENTSNNEEYLAPIKELTDSLKTIKKDINNEIKSLKSEIKSIESEISPIKTELNDVMSDIKDTLDEFKALTEKDLPSLEKQYEENFRNIDETSMPSVLENTTPESEEISPSKSLFETRDYEEVGDRSVNAYQYDNPEVMPYFQAEAKAMLDDLKSSVKGERMIIGDISQTGNGDYQYTGTTRETTQDIAELLDGIDGKYKLSYADIEKGLNAIIQNHGAENIAASKRIEFYLDQRLRKGYTAIDGTEIPSNQDYLNTLKASEIEKYYSSIPVGEAPSTQTEDIAPVRTMNTTESTNDPIMSYVEQLVEIENNKEKLKEERARNRAEKARVKAAQQEQARLDKIARENTVKSKATRAWDTFQSQFVNRNRQLDKLSKETSNKEIKYKADRMNNISGEIGGDVFTAQTDNYGNVIGKALDTPFAKARELGIDGYFDNYLKHQSNIERHAQGKGSTVSAYTSKQYVQAYEVKFPVLKELSQDVYTYNQNMLNNAVENGIIDTEFRDRLNTMYGKYVPFYENNIEATPSIDMSPDEIRGAKPIKRAKGGTSTDLLGVEQAMIKQTYSWKNAIAKNDLYKEIANTSNNTVNIGADVRDNPTTLSDSLYADETGKYLTAYVNGQQKTIQVSEDLFKELSRDLEHQIKEIEDKYSIITKPLQKISQVRGQILTTYNPTFVVTNPFKDIQDALLNTKNLKGYAKNITSTFPDSKKARNLSEYATKFNEITGQDINSITSTENLSNEAKKLYKNYQDGQLWNRFITSYGTNATNMEYSESNVDVKAKNKGFLNKIANANDYMEVMFRYPEFKQTIKNGGSFTEALYNAREITTNFGRGGTISKAINRNGATFFNTSIQGLDKFVRNFSGENGARGFIGAASKAVMLGMIPAVLNHLVLGDDDDYEALPDYVKDNYYLFKTGDGSFIRIPKGRMISVLGSAARRTLETTEGEENAFDGYLKNVSSQVGSTNPLKENILSPLIQAYGSENGEAWYGGDLVPKRLQNKPAAEQYDESTDELSKFIGKTFNISPYKLNYVIDQYTGGFGDIALPMMTKEATSDAEGAENLLAPIKDKFVVNSTDDNKYVGELYDISDELTKKANSEKASDEDFLKNKYINSVKSEMNDLYKQKREIQNSNLSNKEKYSQVQQIQAQINALSKEALETYKTIDSSDYYSKIGDKEFYKNNKGEWTKLSDKEADALSTLPTEDKSYYFETKDEITDIRNDKEAENNTKKYDTINAIMDSKLSDEGKAYLYSRYYDDEEKVMNIVNSGTSMNNYLKYEQATDGMTSSGKEQYLLSSGLSNASKQAIYEFDVLGDTEGTDYEIAKNFGISINEWLKYDSQDFESDKDASGKTISGSRKAKVMSYIESLNLTVTQKALLTRLEYTTFDTYNNQILQYIDTMQLTEADKRALYDKLGFKYSNGMVRW